MEKKKITLMKEKKRKVFLFKTLKVRRQKLAHHWYSTVTYQLVPVNKRASSPVADVLVSA